MPQTSLFAFGAWRQAQQIWARANGTWFDSKEVWVNQGGTWRKVFQKAFPLNVTTSGFNFNVYNSAAATGQWNGVDPVNANITISGDLGSTDPYVLDWNTYLVQNPDVFAIGQSYHLGAGRYAARHYGTNGQFEGRQLCYSGGTPAFDTGSLPAGSSVTVTVNGGSTILGAGGQGGFGGYWIDTQSYDFPSEPGTPGGIAMRLQCPTTIINNGVIGGGGGGGGGGAGGGGGQAYDDPGGGGGGGAGYSAGLAGGSGRGGSYPGVNGSFFSGGAGGQLQNQGSSEWNTASAGGRGGDCGQGGNASAASQGGPGYPGGPGGIAVQNSGNASWQVYGDVRGSLA